MLRDDGSDHLHPGLIYEAGGRDFTACLPEDQAIRANSMAALRFECFGAI